MQFSAASGQQCRGSAGKALTFVPFFVFISVDFNSNGSAPCMITGMGTRIRCSLETHMCVFFNLVPCSDELLPVLGLGISPSMHYKLLKPKHACCL